MIQITLKLLKLTLLSYTTLLQVHIAQVLTVQEKSATDMRKLCPIVRPMREAQGCHEDNSNHLSCLLEMSLHKHATLHDMPGADKINYFCHQLNKSFFKMSCPFNFDISILI